MTHPIVPVAIVTGAGSGIGKAIALLLAREGFRLVLVGRDKAKLEATARQAPDHAQVLVVPADVSEPRSGHEMVNACIARFGRLDVLVNNAATAPLMPIGDHSPEVIEYTFRCNAAGPACAIAAAWPVFTRQFDTGQVGPLGQVVVNISTLGTLDPFPGFFAYASSKAAVNLMALVCAKEGREIGVTAFAIAPGAVETPMLRDLFGTDVLPPSACLSPQRIAEEVLACVQGERTHQNGQTLFIRPQ